MANRFVRDMLMSRYSNDGRNPYGSRGGYVSSRRPRRDRDMGDYGYEDMRRGDYGYDMARGRGRGRGGRRDYGDYGDYADYGEEMKLTKRDFEKWKKELKNSDGTKGEHFHKEQIEQMAKQWGTDVNKYGGADVFAMTMNMMYSDYCGVAKKYGVDRPEYYAELSKAFLDDKDFEGEGAEKLALYYKCIVEKDED